MAEVTATNKTVLLMAGGTGGHVFPALAVAQALRKQGISVYWLGTRRGMESQIVPAAGIDIFYINISGLRGTGLLNVFLAPFKILLALGQAIHILRKCRPDAVIGMGGFVAGPGGIAAWLLRIPLLIHEQNAIAGLTNRWLAKLADVVMQAFPNTFESRYQAVYTGNPLRADILAIKPQQRNYNTLKILIIGGSLGAKILNDTVPKALQLIEDKADKFEIWHQVGQSHAAAMQEIYQHSPFKTRVSPFIDNMAAAYQWADVVICRAGALTISELAQTGTPSILVPYPYAVDDHQTRNAQFLSEKGAAILLPQPNLNPERLSILLHALLTLLNSPYEVKRMAQAARHCATPEALDKVVNLCLKTIS